MQWHTLTISEAEDQLGTSHERGLKGDEANIRLQKYGHNWLEERHKVHWYNVFIRQFTDFLILILFVAAAISMAVGGIADSLTILAIVVLNGILGFIQEWKAETSFKQLKHMLPVMCRVIRNHRIMQIEASYLVPGDLVVIESGDDVPADLRLVEAINLKIDEAALTGESFDVEKSTSVLKEDVAISQRSCMAWMGTTVVNGRGLGLVTATGMHTEFGHIVSLTSAISRKKTNLQRQLNVLAKTLALLASIVAVFIMVIGIFLDKPWLQMLMEGISLAVAAVPEGLPAVVTITLAIGIRAMARRKALMRNLQAAETLGATSVICTDKTGTLTKNEMTVQKIYFPNAKIVEVSGAGYDPEGSFSISGDIVQPADVVDLMSLLRSGAVCNHAQLVKGNKGWMPIGSPTEAALVVAARKAGVEDGHRCELLSEFSFNSERKRMSVIEKTKDKLVSHVKGAPEVLLERSQYVQIDGQKKPMTEQIKSQITKAYKDFAHKGLRILAVASKEMSLDSEMTENNCEQGLTFLGVLGLIDPPREEVMQAVQLSQQAGIKVIMITGDSPDTALTIAKQVGLTAEQAVTGEELTKLEDKELKRLINMGVVFARSDPTHKIRIVKLLQEDEKIVAMTGDGVNDAPALKQADVGIAMGIKGTDVAKGAADMVLIDDNFASIVSAIEEGRRQYANIQKFVRYLLSSNLGEVLAIFLNVSMGAPLILLPVQILWMNLVTDGMTAVALGLEKVEAKTMQQSPRLLSAPILGKGVLLILLMLGGYLALATLFVFHIYLNHEPQAYMVANTIAFTGLIVFEKMNVFNFRALSSPLSKIGYFSNPWLLLAIVVTVGLQVCAVYIPFLQEILHTVPLTYQDWGMIVLLGLPIFIIPELAKRRGWSMV